MEVVNARSALLSNFEVLDLLRELESDYLARTKTALRIKKEEESAGIAPPVGKPTNDPKDDISENLRTIEVEAIQYLAADYQPSLSQTPESISQLVKDLEPFELTKAEKLQVVNLAPVEAVELYVIVEELEDRLGERMDDILTHVRSSLSIPPQPLLTENGQNDTEEHVREAWDADVDEEQVYDANEIVFDDRGEGAGVEGDLDMDDDD